MPSLRQFLAWATNCSRCHFTVMRDPTGNGRLTRRQAPEGDLSSIVAAAQQEFPLPSSHISSARAHIVVRGSTAIGWIFSISNPPAPVCGPSMPSVSANGNRSLVTCGWGLEHALFGSFSQKAASIPTQADPGTRKSRRPPGIRRHAAERLRQCIRCGPRPPWSRAIRWRSNRRRGERGANR